MPGAEECIVAWRPCCSFSLSFAYERNKETLEKIIRKNLQIMSQPLTSTCTSQVLENSLSSRTARAILLKYFIFLN